MFCCDDQLFLPCFSEIYSILLHEHIFKVIHILEVIEAVFGCLTEDFFVDHIDDDMAKVNGLGHAPVFEHQFCHCAVMFEAEHSYSAE